MRFSKAVAFSSSGHHVCHQNINSRACQSSYSFTSVFSELSFRSAGAASKGSNSEWLWESSKRALREQDAFGVRCSSVSLCKLKWKLQNWKNWKNSSKNIENSKKQTTHQTFIQKHPEFKKFSSRKYQKLEKSSIHLLRFAIAAQFAVQPRSRSNSLQLNSFT